MFNSEQKERFLTERAKTAATRRNYIKFFDAIAPYEEEWGVDMCCQADKEKLLGAMAALIGPRGDKKSARFRVAASYCQWCVDSGVKNARNYMKGAGDLAFDMFKRGTVVNPKHLQAYLDEVFSPENSGSREVMYRAYFWMAYIGINKKDIGAVTEEDVDLGDRLITFDGIEYELPRESIMAFSQCINLKSFVSNEGKVMSRPDKGALLRGVFSNISPRSIENRIREVVKRKSVDSSLDLDTELSYSLVRDSGAFYRAYQAENDGETPDFSLVIKGDIKDASTLTDDELSKKWKGRETIYRRNYKRWKKAHNLD